MSSTRTSRQSGFALILALLALVLLTTMGLALSNSTSTELQISSNHRWSEAARFNAEAGIEYGMSILANANWATILPAARAVPDWAPTAWDAAPGGGATGAPCANCNQATRNFENWRCDGKGYGMGYGVVFDDGGPQGPEEYRTSIGGVNLNGAFTLWVRRPVKWNGVLGVGTQLEDYPTNDVLILVSEGVAPYQGGALLGTVQGGGTSGFSAANRAVYTIETILTNSSTTTITDSTSCGGRQGQAGGSASGNNVSGCIALGGGGQITEALTGVGGVGTGAVK